jgi:hypothetical protein
MKLAIRPADAGDRAFIAASWSTSAGRPAQVVGILTRDAWRTAVWSSVPEVLDRPGVRALVAADPTEDTRRADLFGFLVWEPAACAVTPDPRTRQPVYRRAAAGPLPLVWFCYVKAGYRFDRASTHNARIASGLFRAAGIDPRSPFPYVCDTRFVGRLRDAGKLPAAQWRPELGRDPAAHHED